MQAGRLLSILSLVVGVVYYVAAVAGLLFAEATPPGDVGLVSTTAIFVLLGGLGLLLTRAKPTQA